MDEKIEACEPSSTNLTRRDFLELVKGVGMAFAFVNVVNGFGIAAGKNLELEDYLMDEIPLAFQLDIPPGYAAYTPTDAERIGDLTRDTALAARIANENNYYPSGSTLTRFGAREVILIPGYLDLFTQDPRQLMRVLSEDIYPRIVNNSKVSDGNDFTNREREIFGGEIRRSIVPFLKRVLPRPATRGVVLLQRPDSEVIRRYEMSQGSGSVEKANGFTHTGPYKDATEASFSWRRDMGFDRMVEADTPEGLVLSRIYLTRQPSGGLRERLTRSPFNPLDPEWVNYLINIEKVLAHELAHLFVSDKIVMPPFDLHRIISAVGIGAVLEGMTQRGQWQQGGLKDNLWDDPYLQLMRRDEGVFKKLFDSLGVNKKPFPMVFSEQEVVAAFETVVSENNDLKGMGSATDILKQIDQSVTSVTAHEDNVWLV